MLIVKNALCAFGTKRFEKKLKMLIRFDIKLKMYIVDYFNG